jgi:hypothetical protein
MGGKKGKTHIEPIFWRYHVLLAHFPECVLGISTFRAKNNALKKYMLRTTSSKDLTCSKKVKR